MSEGEPAYELDPRLEGVDLDDPEAVRAVLAHPDGSFDHEAYLALPIGLRLLTVDELSELDRDTMRPTHDEEGRQVPGFSRDVVMSANIGETLFHQNWDPEKKEPVYSRTPDWMYFDLGLEFYLSEQQRKEYQ